MTDGRLRKKVWDVLPVCAPGEEDRVIGLTRMQIVEACGLTAEQVAQVLKVLKAAMLLVELGKLKRPVMWARVPGDLPMPARGRPRSNPNLLPPATRPAQPPKPAPAPAMTAAAGKLSRDSAARKLLIDQVWLPQLLKGGRGR